MSNMPDLTEDQRKLRSYSKEKDKLTRRLPAEQANKGAAAAWKRLQVAVL